MLALTTVLLLAANAGAQTSDVAKMEVVDSMAVPPGAPATSLFDGIQLTKSQQDTIDALTRRDIKLFNAINAEKSGIRIRQRQFLAVREKSRREKRALLTPAQWPAYDKNAAAQKATDERISRDIIAAVESHHP